MSEAVFEIEYYREYVCDAPRCTTYPTVEVRLVGMRGSNGHAQVCRKHIAWAKSDQIERDRRAALAAAAPGDGEEG